MGPENLSLTATWVQTGSGLQLLGRHDASFREAVDHSLDVIRRALDMFTPAALAVSFNGGKDACVVLYLLMIVLAERGQLGALVSDPGLAANLHDDGASTLPLPPSASSPASSAAAAASDRMDVVYFEKQEFPAVSEFLDTISKNYGISYRRYACSYKDGMADLVSSRGCKAVLMGQRYGDPWTSGMEEFAPSTPGWPPFTRVNPILKWKFGHVWKFLKGCGLPYCRLYDEGYTSLGEAHDTEPNPSLRRPDGTYRAAWQLVDEDLERAYRRCRRKSEQQLQRAISGGVNEEYGGGDAGASCSDSDDSASVTATSSEAAEEMPPTQPLSLEVKKGGSSSGGRSSGGSSSGGSSGRDEGVLLPPVNLDLLPRPPPSAAALAAASGHNGHGRGGSVVAILKRAKWWAPPIMAAAIAALLARLFRTGPPPQRRGVAAG